jgi:lysophospholipase L1-like esterase
VVALALLLISPVTGAGGRPVSAPERAVHEHRAKSAATHPGLPLHVLFVGASITAGLERTSLGDTYPGQVVPALREECVSVDWQERARSGATVADALIWPYLSGQQIIVLPLIANDFLLRQPARRRCRGLHRVLAHLRQRSPSARLVCIGSWEAPGKINLDRVPLTTYDAAARS